MEDKSKEELLTLTELTTRYEQLLNEKNEVATLLKNERSLLATANDRVHDLETGLAEIKLLHETAMKTAQEQYDVVLAVNKELTLQVEELSYTPGQKTPVAKTVDLKTAGFERNGVGYGFNYASTVLKGGRKITAADVLADEALQDELISKNSPMLKGEDISEQE